MFNQWLRKSLSLIAKRPVSVFSMINMGLFCWMEYFEDDLMERNQCAFLLVHLSDQLQSMDPGIFVVIETEASYRRPHAGWHPQSRRVIKVYRQYPKATYLNIAIGAFRQAGLVTECNATRSAPAQHFARCRESDSASAVLRTLD
jgi:hypothetical protein